MIESLKYVVTFNTTGRTLKNHLKFKPGITVIKGENEAGKSFVLEMIRYALFGTEALRGAREDYGKLDVTLVCYIKGKKYTIVRSGNKATVNGTEAVGTTATNKYIRKQLGFGLNVFDISANAQQGELDKLTKDMGPTERRKVIDEVTGLSQFEKAEKECREEANAFRKIAEALKAQAVEPELPIMPLDYEESGKLKLRLDFEIRNKAIRDSLEHVALPVEPVKPDGDPSAIEHEQERRAWNREKQKLVQSLSRLPEVNYEYTHDELIEFRDSMEQAARGPLPREFTFSQLEGWAEDHRIRQRESEPLRCGECGAIVQGRELPPVPPLTLDEIELEFLRKRIWEGKEYDYSLKASPLSKREVAERLAAYEAQPERALLEKQIKELGDEPKDCSDEAEAWISYEEDLRRAQLAKEAYGKYLVKKAEVDALPPPEELLAERYELSLRYETLMARYEAQLEVYEKQLEQAKGAEEKREAYKRGSDALKDARKEVKQYLVPSLSKVASNLLVEMTDGQRRHIFIDENFDIWVDKQPVRTLSGSGVSVVNLALRIALGQVLTQSVIPIFLADEIDANMAAKRTEATHKSLHRLKKKLTQIIVVTHKEFEGDHTLCLS